MEEWVRIPEERGSLDPPRRPPPTAIGIATPPPPHRRGDDERTSARSRRHVKPRAVVGFIVTLGGGVAVGWVLPVVASMTVATGLTALLVAWRLRRRRSRRLWARYHGAVSRAA